MYPNAYIQYLIHFHGDRDYFECHEILEEYWKEEPRGKRKPHWVGLIQIAVSLYHHRRGNWKGAARMMEHALAILQKEEAAIRELGLDYEALLHLLGDKLDDIIHQRAYKSIMLPIADAKLTQTCIQQCRKMGLQFGSDSDMTNLSLLHRHTMRDRSDVIAERQRQLQKRKQR